MTLDLDALRGHTAGPWDVEYGYEDYGDGPVKLVYGIYAGKQRIVETDSGVYEMSVTDAKLICAAPQLLSELLAYRARDAAAAELEKAARKVAYGNWNHAAVEEIVRLREALLAFRQGADRED